MPSCAAKATFRPAVWRHKARSAQTRGPDLFFRLALFRLFIHGVLIQATGRENAEAHACAPRRPALVHLQFERRSLAHPAWCIRGRHGEAVSPRRRPARVAAAHADGRGPWGFSKVRRRRSRTHGVKNMPWVLAEKRLLPLHVEVIGDVERPVREHSPKVNRVVARGKGCYHQVVPIPN
jgi:hypothetical protein